MLSVFVCSTSVYLLQYQCVLYSTNVSYAVPMCILCSTIVSYGVPMCILCSTNVYPMLKQCGSYVVPMCILCSTNLNRLFSSLFVCSTNMQVGMILSIVKCICKIIICFRILLCIQLWISLRMCVRTSVGTVSVGFSRAHVHACDSSVYSSIPNIV